MPAAVVDIRERVAQDHDTTLRPDDVLDWERRYGPLPDRCAVLMLSGWGERISDAEPFLNADDGGTFHSPGFGAEVAHFLREERPGVRMIGTETSSLDIGATTGYPAHRSWLPSGARTPVRGRAARGSAGSAGQPVPSPDPYQCRS